MLINTVLMFLRELLPLCLLLATLLVWHRVQWRYFMLLLLVPAAALLLLISSQMLTISELWDGLGLEVLYSLLYLCCFVLLCFAALTRPWALACSALAAACLLSVSGNNLVLYIWLPTQQNQSAADLMLGAVLGIGIAASIAVLWYYLLTELKQWRVSSFSVLLAVLGARQVMMASALLIQSDWLPAGPVVWQSESWISERSELGYFLLALAGYEASPVLSQLLLFLSCFGLLFWCCRVMEKTK